MKLVSWNVNGLRAAYNKGFLDWFQKEKADVVCLQEIKVKQEQLDLFQLNPMGYHSYWHSAEKPGYSGVAIYSKKEPLSVKYGIGKSEIDNEGRVLTVEYKDFFLVNTYFPNSQREHARLDYKLMFCDKILRFCKKLKKEKNVVLCGDYNIAHEEIDLKNPKQNINNAGFLPEERAWMGKFLSQGFLDVFRDRVKEPHHYTWWSYRPGIRDRNIGWRIDYHCINEEFNDRIKKVYHKPDVLGSDHCPIYLEVKN
mgnify:CR=1 FL=1